MLKVRASQTAPSTGGRWSISSAPAGSEAAQVARKGAADQDAGLENSAGGDHGYRAARPSGPLQKGGSQVSKVSGSFVAQMARHQIALAGRLDHQRKERGDLLWFELSGNDLNDLPKAQMLADAIRKQSLRPAAVESLQRRGHRFASQIVAGAAIVKRNAPPAGAQQFALIVTREGEGSSAGDLR